ncbi:unnamed protein product [Symbiodinium sp. CCMP2592]|nr:unnamed protein product [Symbiodinium sp. CCMP2592]
MQRDPEAVPSFVREAAGDSDEADDSPDAEEPPAKRCKDQGITTLLHVLAAADLCDFRPADDCPRKLFARLRALHPHMASLNRRVRLAERLLSAPLINGKMRSPRDQVRWEHLLAKARAALLLFAANQTRHQLWADYSSRCVQAASVKKADPGVELTGATPPVELRPWDPVVQVVACRPLVAAMGALNGMRLAVVVASWRAARGNGKKALNGKGALPITAASCLHVVLLEPEQFQKEPYVFSASTLSPVFCIEAHSGSLLYEVPAEAMQVKQGQNHVYIGLNQAAFDAYVAIANAQVALDPSKPDRKSCPQGPTVYYVADDFKNSASGRSNMKSYAVLMLQDYERLFQPIRDEQGHIRLDDIQLPWEALLARLPGYFATRCVKNTAHWKSFSTEQRAKGFPQLVLEELLSMSPKPEQSPKRFVSWLRSVHFSAPGAVMVAVG